MGYRNVMISNNVSLSIKNAQLIIDNTDISIPVEDINCLVLEGRAIKVSTYMLEFMSSQGVVVFMCDEKHIPSTVVLPLSIHSRHFKMLKLQIGLGKPFQKRLWQQIVVQKICNQARCLELLGKDNAKELYQMSKEVQSGDKTHVEAKAAALYFRSLFGKDFARSDENLINASLNYLYAIVRGIIARTIISYGFEPSIGLFHKSELNAYNLADDMIEPFRPMVDYYVVSNGLTEDGDMTPDIKKMLFKFLNYDMSIQGENHIISNSIDKMIKSFSSCLNGNKETLLMPDVIELRIHSYE